MSWNDGLMGMLFEYRLTHRLSNPNTSKVVHQTG